MIQLILLLPAMALFDLASPAKAESIEIPPSCLSAYGNIWGDDIAEAKKREIDGGSIKTSDDLARATGTREGGLKIIKGGDFSGWDMRGLSLSNVCFEESKMRDANMAGVEGEGAGFIRSDLTDTDLQGAGLTGVLFRDTKLSGVRAQGANLNNGQFDGGWFEGSVDGWNLDGAHMRGFTFECGITIVDGCPVYSGGEPISAKGTDFTGATLHSFGLFYVNTSGATLDGTIVGPRQLPGLRGADFKGGIFLRGGDSDIRITPDEIETLLYENSKQAVISANPSFDCSDARTRVEEEICGEYAQELRLFDREVAALYKSAKKRDPNVRASQLAWLKRRDTCNAEEYPVQCISESYAQRSGELLAIFGETDWLKTGEEALFLGDILPLPDSFKNSALFQKITPALVGASRTEILVKREEDGLYSIEGSTVGANAHLCSLSASHLYFEKETGWYVITTDGPRTPIFRVIGDRLEIFKNGKPDYEQYPDAGDFISCGARASFPDTRRIAVDDEVLAKMRTALTAVR